MTILYEEIKMGDLKTVCKELNNSGVLKKNIRTVGVNKQDLTDNFMDEVEKLFDKKGVKLPKSVVAFYDSLPEEGSEKGKKVKEIDEPEEMDEDEDLVDPDEEDEEGAAGEDDEDDDGSDDEDEEETSWEDLLAMDKDVLVALVEENKLISVLKDYNSVKEFRAAIAEEVGIAVPEDYLSEEKPEKKKGKGKAKAKAKTEKPVKEKTENKKKEPKVITRSRYGHLQNAKSGMLDDLLFEGNSVGDIKKKADVKLGRIKSHLKVLKDKGLTVLVKENKDDGDKTTYQIKEEKI